MNASSSRLSAYIEIHHVQIMMFLHFAKKHKKRYCFKHRHEYHSRLFTAYSTEKYVNWAETWVIENTRTVKFPFNHIYCSNKAILTLQQSRVRKLRIDTESILKSMLVEYMYVETNDSKK